jgi:hypothetical protein
MKRDNCLRIGQCEIVLCRNPDEAAQAEAVAVFWRQSGDGLRDRIEERGGVLVALVMKGRPGRGVVAWMILRPVASDAALRWR